MTWVNGGYGSSIPTAVKRAVWSRDQGLCQIGRAGCTEIGEEYDHIVNVAGTGQQRRELNRPELLQLVCSSCHRSKTQAEARAGRARWKRVPERHPGLLH